VKIRTNRFYITHNLGRLHKEQVSEVTGKWVIKKHSDSLLYRVIVLSDIYRFVTFYQFACIINVAFPTDSPHARRNGGAKYQTVIIK
jgi:hypothetical protein